MHILSNFRQSSISQTQEKTTRKKTGQQVYFQGNRKNQLNDLKKYFRTILYDSDKAFLRKQLIKRIINDTTRGVDTSRLFPQMVLASSTKDLIQKKMIYFYLTTFSQSNESFAQMAINTFLKDTNSNNPNIRSLSLRHLSNFRFKGRDQYVLPLLKHGLTDFNPLVKKSSIMGLTKIVVESNRNKHQPQRQEEILNLMYNLIRDHDAGVVCSAMEAINQIQPEGLVMNKKLANYLLENLTKFDQYQLPIVLKYYELYEPKTQQQIVNSMNILYSKLRSSVLSVTLGIAKIYLRYSQLFPTYLDQILSRLRRPLLSFLNNDSQQIEYVALKHIEYIIEKYHSEHFKKDLKKFYLKSSQPTYVKFIKIHIIELNTDKDNLIDVVNQISQYIGVEQTSKCALKALQRLMMTCQDINNSKFICKTIIKTIQNTWNDFLPNNSLPLLRNFLRKHPQQFHFLQNIFYTLVDKACQVQSRCSLLQIVGQFGQHIQDAIQIVNWNQKQKQDQVKICMIRANVMIFLKRPLQMINVITNMFNSIFRDDQLHLLVRDYAAFVYRALQQDINGFKTLYLETRNQKQLFTAQTPKLQINSLEIVYRKQQYKWLIQKDKFFQNLQQVSYEQIAQVQIPEGKQRSHSEQIKSQIDFCSGFKRLQAQDLDPQFQLQAQVFQQNWQSFQLGSSITRMLTQAQLLNDENLQQLFTKWHFGVMASAEDQNQIKLYLYCKVKRDMDTDVALLEVQVNKLADTITVMVKTQNQEASGFVSKYVEEFLNLNQII